MKFKILILPLSIVVSVMAVILYVKPSYSVMQEAKASLAAKQSQLEEIKAQNQKIQKVKSSWEDLGEEKNIVAMALPESKSVDYYISEINSKATRSGVLLTDVKVGQQSSVNTDSPSYLCGSADSSAVPAPASAAPAGAPSTPPLPGQTSPVAAIVPSCLNSLDLSFTVKGTWEQMLDFLKYLEDMNRLSNLQSLNITTESAAQGQAASDMLTFNISTQSFYKQKNPTAAAGMASNLVSQAGINQGALEKLKKVIFSLYSPPQVSPTGQRNLFK